MGDTLLHDVLLAAGGHVERARRRLDLEGARAVDVARAELEAAVATLEPVAADDALPRTAREEVERWRVSLASHLLAARDVDDAGAARATVARLLLRATVRPASQPTAVVTACSTALRTSASSRSSVTFPPPAART